MSDSPQPEGNRRGYITRLLIIFSLVYIVDGLAQSPLYTQTVTNYLKNVIGWAPDHVTQYLTITSLPWVIKPIYGLISDFVPLFGYRRKSWLFVSNLLAGASFVWLAFLTHPDYIIVALVLANFGIAASTTLCSALVVENGKKHSMSGSFVNVQWIWFYISTVAASVGAGWIAQHLDPTSALHTSAMILGLSPIIVLVGTVYFVHEEKAKVDIAGFKTSFASLLAVFKSRVFWLVALFIFFYNFNPGFGTPLYYYETDTLKFDQQFIGNLSAIGAAGSVLGGFIYAFMLKRMTLKTLLIISVLLGALSQASYLLLSGEVSAIVLAVANGIFGMITVVSLMTLAADYCPDGAEGFAYALLMSVNNVAHNCRTMSVPTPMSIFSITSWRR